MVPLMTYRALLFDVMATLVYEPFYEVVPAALGMTLEELWPQLSRNAWVDFEHARTDEATFLSRFFADGRAFDHAALKAALVKAYAWLDGMEELLAELQLTGQEMHLLSNYPEWYQLIEDKLRISRYAPWTFVSCRTGVRKPHPEAYLGAARHLGIEPEALLFIDDREVNCQGARDVGMAAIRFEDTASLRVELRARGVLPD
jgi:HAD superfamily hydrolase (TIGR01509 family)